MIQPTTEQGLVILRDYMAQLTEAYPEGDSNEGGECLKLVIRFLIHVLNRKISTTPATFDWLQSIKTTRRIAAAMVERLLEEHSEAFNDWNPKETVMNAQQECAVILIWSILELDTEINQQERAWPELKFAFDRERARYAQMRAEALEAEAP